MRRKKVRIPLYGGWIIIYRGDLKEIAEKYNIHGVDDAVGAYTFETDMGYNHYMVFPEGEVSVCDIAHESMHILNGIFIRKEIRHDPHNDEPAAYLLGWIIQIVYDFLKDD